MPRRSSIGFAAAKLLEDAGCVVNVAKADFETLLDDPSQGMMLFTMGKLQVSNVGLALSLQQLLS